MWRPVHLDAKPRLPGMPHQLNLTASLRSRRVRQQHPFWPLARSCLAGYERGHQPLRSLPEASSSGLGYPGPCWTCRVSLAPRARIGQARGVSVPCIPLFASVHGDRPCARVTRLPPFASTALRERNAEYSSPWRDSGSARAECPLGEAIALATVAAHPSSVIHAQSAGPYLSAATFLSLSRAAPALHT